MPDEMKRIDTDSISDWLFVSDPSGRQRLKREGHADRAAALHEHSQAVERHHHGAGQHAVKGSR